MTRPAGMAAAALALAVWVPWPLASCLSSCIAAPTGPDPFANARLQHDGHLILWILAWTTHALTTTEHMLRALPLYLPSALVTGDPVAAEQLTLLLVMVVSFLGAAALVGTWTGSWPAAFLAASFFAFSPFRIAHLGALQIGGIYYLPLTVLCAERAVAGRGLGWSVGLAAGLTLQALHSYHLAYATTVAVGVLFAMTLATDPASVRAGPASSSLSASRSSRWCSCRSRISSPVGTERLAWCRRSSSAGAPLASGRPVRQGSSS